jgi:electron transport complex protein RnfA
MVIFSGVRQRIEHNNIPESFKGVPITLIAASVLALAFMGFSGVIDGIFGA